jgi:hypothetical protein
MPKHKKLMIREVSVLAVLALISGGLPPTITASFGMWFTGWFAKGKELIYRLDL